MGGVAPTNAATTGTNKGKLVTGPDGSYKAVIVAKDVGETADVSVTRKDMSFVPAVQTVPAHAGADISGINFTAFLHATITGRVKDPDGDALGGVEVTAANVVLDGADAEVSSTSNARGTFRLSVPFGVYDIAASLDELHLLVSERQQPEGERCSGSGLWTSETSRRCRLSPATDYGVSAVTETTQDGTNPSLLRWQHGQLIGHGHEPESPRTIQTNITGGN